mgnify:CR=1 FL=1
MLITLLSLHCQLFFTLNWWNFIYLFLLRNLDWILWRLRALHKCMCRRKYRFPGRKRFRNNFWTPHPTLINLQGLKNEQLFQFNWSWPKGLTVPVLVVRLSVYPLYQVMWGALMDHDVMLNWSFKASNDPVSIDGFSNQCQQGMSLAIGSVVSSSVKQLVPKCNLRHCAGSLLFKTLFSLPAFLLWKSACFAWQCWFASLVGVVQCRKWSATANDPQIGPQMIPNRRKGTNGIEFGLPDFF